ARTLTGKRTGRGRLTCKRTDRVWLARRRTTSCWWPRTRCHDAPPRRRRCRARARVADAARWRAVRRRVRRVDPRRARPARRARVCRRLRRAVATGDDLASRVLRRPVPQYLLCEVGGGVLVVAGRVLREDLLRALLAAPTRHPRRGGGPAVAEGRARARPGLRLHAVRHAGRRRLHVRPPPAPGDAVPGDPRRARPRRR